MVAHKALPYVKFDYLVTKQPEAYQQEQDHIAQGRPRQGTIVRERNNLFTDIPNDAIVQPIRGYFTFKWKQALGKIMSLSPAEHWANGAREFNGEKVNQNQWKQVNLAYLSLVDDKSPLIKCLEAIEPKNVHNESSILLADLLAIHRGGLDLANVESINTFIKQRRSQGGLPQRATIDGIKSKVGRPVTESHQELLTEHGQNGSTESLTCVILWKEVMASSSSTNSSHDWWEPTSIKST